MTTTEYVSFISTPYLSLDSVRIPTDDILKLELAPKSWRHKVMSDIHWLKDPIHEDFAEAHMAVRPLLAAKR